MFSSLFLTLLGKCCFVFGLFCICCIYLFISDEHILSALGPIIQQLRLCQSQSSPGPPPTVVSEAELLKNSLNIMNGVLIIVSGNLSIKLVDIIFVISVLYSADILLQLCINND